jgi:hypothetical protein
MEHGLGQPDHMPLNVLPMVIDAVLVVKVFEEEIIAVVLLPGVADGACVDVARVPGLNVVSARNRSLPGQKAIRRILNFT